MPEFLKAIFMLLKILLKKNESNWTGGSGDICIVSFSRTDSYCTDGNTVFGCDSDKNSLVVIYMF